MRVLLFALVATAAVSSCAAGALRKRGGARRTIPQHVVVARNFESDEPLHAAEATPSTEWRYISTNHPEGAAQVDDPSCGEGKECRRVAVETACLGSPCVMRAAVVKKVHGEDHVEIVPKGGLEVHKVVDEKAKAAKVAEPAPEPTPEPEPAAEAEAPAPAPEPAATGCDTEEAEAAPPAATGPPRITIHKIGCTGSSCEDKLTIVHVDAPADGAEASESERLGEPCHDCVEPREHVQRHLELAKLKVHAQIAKEEAAAAAAAEEAAAAAAAPCVNCVDSEEKAAQLLAAAKARVFA